MKKLIIIIALFGSIGAAYLYFKRQLELALNYEYDVDSFKILKLNQEEMDVQLTLKITNKSDFEVEINAYDIEILYNNVKILRILSQEKFIIKGKSTFEIKTINNIIFKEVKEVMMPFILNVIQKKPLNVTLKGFLKCKFLNLPYSLNFDNEKFLLSSDLLTEYGISQKIDSIKQKIPFIK